MGMWVRGGMDGMGATICVNLRSWCQECRFCQLRPSVKEKKGLKSALPHCLVIMRVALRTVGPSPQPASWTPQSLSPWSGTSCRSPRPPYSHSSSSWSISLWKQKVCRFRFIVIHVFTFVVPRRRSSWTTDLIGWWFRHCRMQTVWPGPWREAEMQHWWSHCSAPLDEPERRKRRETCLAMLHGSVKQM